MHSALNRSPRSLPICRNNQQQDDWYSSTAVIEIGAGLLLAAVPASAVTFLFGVLLTTPVERALAQMAGVALLALGFACWLARTDA